MSFSGFVVPAELDHKVFHPMMPKIFLIEGDLLTKSEDGTWFIQAPGMGIGKWVLTPEQEALLKPVQYENVGLSYRIVDG